MVSAERIQVTLTGGTPWGFRLAGGGSLPLTINKIRKKSRAHTQGLVEGDAVLSINGVAVHDKSQDEALELVENSGDTLALDIFRGDVDELSAQKPKKAIFIGGGGASSEALTMTTSVEDVQNSTSIVDSQDTSSELILTTSVDDVTSDFYDQSANDVSGGFQLTTTVDDVSATTFDANDTTESLILTTSVDDISANEVNGGFQITTTVDDVSGSAFDTTDTSEGLILTSSVDEISSSTNDVAATASTPVFSIGEVTSDVQEEMQSSKSTEMLAEPFTTVALNGFAADRLSPVIPTSSPSAKHCSPVQSHTAISTINQQQTYSPQPPQPPPASPKSFSVIDAPQNDYQVQPPTVSPKPSNTTSNTSHATFDDGQTRREVTREQHVTTSGDGRGTMVVQRETTSTTTTNKKVVPSFVAGQSSAFKSVQPAAPQPFKSVQPAAPQAFKSPQPFKSVQPAAPPQFGQQYTTSSATTIKSTSSNTQYSNNINTSTPAPMATSISSNYLQYQPPPITPFVSSVSSDSIARQNKAPVFKPSKFVPGGQRKEIPGLYDARSLQVDRGVDEMTYSGGKENVAPAQVMFKVKNIVPKARSRKDLWKPNMWLPEQRGAKPTQAITNDFSQEDFDYFPVPALKPGVSLLQEQQQQQQQRGRQTFKYDYDDDDDDYEYEEDFHQNQKDGRVRIFAPPVEIHAHPEYPYEPYSPDGDYDEYYYEEVEPMSPDSSMIRRKKNLYNDSAFYDTPGKSYPTIDEQMKLCKKIALSLTSQANKRARGAKMFMRRKKRSNKWIHEGHSEWSSSAGDVANIQDLESELSPDQGGNKPLFYFKIPNLRNRVNSEGKQTKMALSQEQFEKLRLQSKKCDHRSVQPEVCFDIVSDLKAHKGRGGRLFERRKQRSDKFVIDEQNVRGAVPQARLENVLVQPVRQEKTPWEAAMAHGGNVDAAFCHIGEMERNQKLNTMLKMSPPRKQQMMPPPPVIQSVPLPPAVRTSLKSDEGSNTLRGKNFNRLAKGWTGGGEYPVAERLQHISPTREDKASSVQYGNYNNMVKAWQGSGQSPYVNSQPQSSHSHRSQQPQQSHQPQQWDPRQSHQTAQGWTGHHQQQSTSSSYRDQRYEQPRPQAQAWQPDNQYGTQYKQEYDYSYLPVDNGYGSGNISNPAYMQPIIPGTDL